MTSFIGELIHAAFEQSPGVVRHRFTWVTNSDGDARAVVDLGEGLLIHATNSVSSGTVSYSLIDQLGGDLTGTLLDSMASGAAAWLYEPLSSDRSRPLPIFGPLRLVIDTGASAASGTLDLVVDTAAKLTRREWGGRG